MMTSTSFSIGLAGETRNSSRVLRPPGGGHTDIFGGEPEPTRGRRQGYAVPPSSIGHGDEPMPKANGAEPVQNGASTPEQPAPAEPAPEAKAAAPEANAPAPEPVAAEPKLESPVKQAAAPVPAPAEAPKRVRVPPGGFSSGLW